MAGGAATVVLTRSLQVAVAFVRHVDGAARVDDQVGADVHRKPVGLVALCVCQRGIGPDLGVTADGQNVRSGEGHVDGQAGRPADPDHGQAGHVRSAGQIRHRGSRSIDQHDVRCARRTAGRPVSVRGPGIRRADPHLGGVEDPVRVAPAVGRVRGVDRATAGGVAVCHARVPHHRVAVDVQRPASAAGQGDQVAGRAANVEVVVHRVGLCRRERQRAAAGKDGVDVIGREPALENYVRTRGRQVQCLRRETVRNGHGRSVRDLQDVEGVAEGCEGLRPRGGELDRALGGGEGAAPGEDDVRVESNGLTACGSNRARDRRSAVDRQCLVAELQAGSRLHLQRVDQDRPVELRVIRHTRGNDDFRVVERRRCGQAPIPSVTPRCARHAGPGIGLADHREDPVGIVEAVRRIHRRHGRARRSGVGILHVQVLERLLVAGYGRHDVQLPLGARLGGAQLQVGSHGLGHALHPDLCRHGIACTGFEHQSLGEVRAEEDLELGRTVHRARLGTREHHASAPGKRIGRRGIGPITVDREGLARGQVN